MSLQFLGFLISDMSLTVVFCVVLVITYSTTPVITDPQNERNQDKSRNNVKGSCSGICQSPTTSN